jgi:4'-phosphopantetheinyl transferase EntD
VGGLDAIVPAGVAVAEWDGAAEPPPGPEGEAESLRTASAGRRREFALARAGARRALALLGMPPVAIPSGPHREPVWPAGVVGSLTHTDGYGAAAVGRAAEFASIGIDAEPHLPVPPGVVRRIALEEERAWLRSREGDGVCWDRLLFSAKESVYKAWFPLTGEWLGFSGALVTFSPALGAFAARLLVPGPMVDGHRVVAFEGRYAVVGGLALTAITVSRGRAAATL